MTPASIDGEKQAGISGGSDAYGLFRALHSHNPGIKILKNSRWIYGTQCQSLNMTLKAICLPVIFYIIKKFYVLLWKKDCTDKKTE